jgi:excisionase family DNA binding protein
MLDTAQRGAAPSKSEADAARSTRQALSRLVHPEQPLSIRVIDANYDQPIALPAGAVAMLLEILELMAAGRRIQILPQDTLVTTVEAAEMLHVSRPFLIKLLDERKIPHQKVGRHRRINIEDVLAYKARIDSERHRVLDELAAIAQSEQMGYPPQS